MMDGEIGGEVSCIIVKSYVISYLSEVFYFKLEVKYFSFVKFMVKFYFISCFVED